MAEEARQTGVLRLYVMYEPLQGERFRLPYHHCQESFVVREGGFTPEQTTDLVERVRGFITFLVPGDAE